MLRAIWASQKYFNGVFRGALNAVIESWSNVVSSVKGFFVLRGASSYVNWSLWRYPFKRNTESKLAVGRSSEHTVNFYKPLSLMEPKNKLYGKILKLKYQRLLQCNWLGYNVELHLLKPPLPTHRCFHLLPIRPLLGTVWVHRLRLIDSSVTLLLVLSPLSGHVDSPRSQSYLYRRRVEISNLLTSKRSRWRCQKLRKKLDWLEQKKKMCTQPNPSSVQPPRIY